MNIYLSMTTMPERISSLFFKQVYTSLKTQSIPFTKLIINLSVKEFIYDIPDYLQKDSSIILNETEFCGPCAKLLGSIDIIPENAIVIVLDDDIVMRNNFIESLYNSYLLNPDKISSHNIIRRKLFYEVNAFSGYILNIEKIRNIRQFYATMPDCCIKIDDTWLSWCFKKLNIEVIQTTEKNAWDNVLDIPLTDTHPCWYELCKHTNRNKLVKDALLILNNN